MRTITTEFQSVPRADFVECVEKGIETAGINGEAKALLDTVAKTHDRIAFETYSTLVAIPGEDEAKMCHCPLSAAGLADDNGDMTPLGSVLISDRQHSAFVRVFDNAIIDKVCEANGGLTSDVVLIKD